MTCIIICFSKKLNTHKFLCVLNNMDFCTGLQEWLLLLRTYPKTDLKVVLALNKLCVLDNNIALGVIMISTWVISI